MFPASCYIWDLKRAQKARKSNRARTSRRQILEQVVFVTKVDQVGD
jgi:hypothetical protein